MKVAIMQPYFIPYLLYFQLIKYVDAFIILDDVSFINRGWINRNLLSIHGKKKWVTIPLSNASQNKNINEISILNDDNWKKKAKKTLFHSYQHSNYMRESINIFDEILSYPDLNLNSFVVNSLKLICAKLSINTKFLLSSSFANIHLKGKYRILDICACMNATEYVNLPGGVILYQENDFNEKKINLKFIQQCQLNDIKSSFQNPYESSILDILFVNGVSKSKDAIASNSF